MTSRPATGQEAERLAERRALRYALQVVVPDRSAGRPPTKADDPVRRPG